MPEKCESKEIVTSPDFQVGNNFCNIDPHNNSNYLQNSHNQTSQNICDIQMNITLEHITHLKRLFHKKSSVGHDVDTFPPSGKLIARNKLSEGLCAHRGPTGP